MAGSPDVERYPDEGVHGPSLLGTGEEEVDRGFTE
jgi:hypothetical protein